MVVPSRAQNTSNKITSKDNIIKNIYITNTLSGEKELFTPINPSNVRMFVCGPTVYGPMHIGHAKTYISYDFISRVIKTLYPGFTYIQNITDVDDKIINKALDEGKTVKEISEYWENKYYENMTSLGNNQVSSYHRAHDHIAEIIEQINILLDGKKAYIIDRDGVYLNTSTINNYRGLNHSATDSEHSRINNPYKLNEADFALWKFSELDAPIGWDSPFGYGRPGWHIEDTAISAKYLGNNYDLHGGAIDLIFPHHEAEIMIMNGISGTDLSNYWMHGGLLTVNGVKMGKSLDNFITVHDVLEDWDSRTIRFFVLSKNYGSNVDWSSDALHQAEQSLRRVENYYHYAPEKLDNDEQVYARILDALYNNFNSSEALSIVFSELTNKTISRQVLRWVNELYNTFNFSVDDVPNEIRLLAEERLLHRRNKNWAMSDQLRDKITSLGWSIRDEKDSYYVEHL